MRQSVHSSINLQTSQSSSTYQTMLDVHSISVHKPTSHRGHTKQCMIYSQYINTQTGQSSLTYQTMHDIHSIAIHKPANHH